MTSCRANANQHSEQEKIAFGDLHFLCYEFSKNAWKLKICSLKMHAIWSKRCYFTKAKNKRIQVATVSGQMPDDCLKVVSSSFSVVSAISKLQVAVRSCIIL